MPDRPIQVAVVSLGCPKALVDSEKMLALLAEAGCLVGCDPSDADVIFINTCAFIAPAREESLAAIREAVARKRRGRVRRVVVAGCLPQKEKDRLFKEVEGIDAVVGVFDREAIVEAVMGGTPKQTALGGGTQKLWGVGCPDDRGRLRLTPRHTAYLRIAEGCCSGCSYCTIPSIRGPLRSKPLDMALDEARELVADGAVELNLIAQDTTAYGRDLSDGTNLPALLAGLDRIEPLRWVRLMYAHPASLDGRTIEALAGCTRLARYIDLPLQHISDGILSAMRRRYTRAHVEALLGELRRALPGICIRTTFIVGFPGETAAQFAELVEFVKAQRFEAVGVFAYCDEPGTPAHDMPAKVPAKTARLRRDRLMKTQQKIAFANNAARVVQVLEVLVEGPDTRGRCLGRHAGQAPDIDSICYLTRPVETGVLVKAKVVGSDGYDLIVEPA